MRILVAIPCMDQVPAPFCFSLAHLRKEGECMLAMKAGALVYVARNNLVAEAIRISADWVFWLDSDMTFAPDTLTRMLKTAQEKGIDILTGLYFRRVPPYSPVLFDKLEEKDGIWTWTEFDKVPEDLFEIGGAGFGCILTKTSVFYDIQERFGTIFTPIGNHGEDLAFCWRARMCGHKIICDPSVKCGHVGHSVIDEKFYLAQLDK